MTTLLKLERLRRKWSLVKLGGMTNIHPTEISRVERGLAVPYPAHRQRLARALKIPAEDLVKPATE